MEKIIEAAKSLGLDVNLKEGLNCKHILFVGDIHTETNKFGFEDTASKFRIVYNKSRFDVFFDDGHKETLNLDGVIEALKGIEK